MERVTQITTLLLKCKNDLVNIYTECRPGFERDFWEARVGPIVFSLELFLLHKATTAYKARIEVECLMIRIRRFTSVYGKIRIIYNILEETRGLLRGFELCVRPESPLSLEDLSRKVVYQNPNLESQLYKCNPNFVRKFDFSFNNFFNLFMILNMKETSFRRKNFKYEVNFCDKVASTITSTETEKDLSRKLEITKKFIKRCEAMKTPSFRKDCAIRKFREFVATYETYL